MNIYSASLTDSTPATDTNSFSLNGLLAAGGDGSASVSSTSRSHSPFGRTGSPTAGSVVDPAAPLSLKAPRQKRRRSKSKIMDQIPEWLKDTFSANELVSIPRNAVYKHYLRHSAKEGWKPLAPASFGKVFRGVFPFVTTRRLGVRGQSKYHYHGVGLKNPEEDAPDITSEQIMVSFILALGGGSMARVGASASTSSSLTHSLFLARAPLSRLATTSVSLQDPTVCSPPNPLPRQRRTRTGCC